MNRVRVNKFGSVLCKMPRGVPELRDYEKSPERSLNQSRATCDWQILTDTCDEDVRFKKNAAFNQVEVFFMLRYSCLSPHTILYNKKERHEYVVRKSNGGELYLDPPFKFKEYKFDDDVV